MIGVCASEGFDFEVGNESVEWLLGNNGEERIYCPSFGDGSKVTVHLDMNQKACSFTVDGTVQGYPKVSQWNNLPSRLLSSSIITSFWSPHY